MSLHFQVVRSGGFAEPEAIDGQLDWNPNSKLLYSASR